jgi:hypothetical protein
VSPTSKGPQKQGTDKLKPRFKTIHKSNLSNKMKYFINSLKHMQCSPVKNKKKKETHNRKEEIK